VTVRVDAVEQLPPVHVLALVVVTLRRQGPAWAEVADHMTNAAIAIRIRISTSVGNKKRSVEPDNVTRPGLVQSGVNPAVYSPSPPSL
jgi:hypothetical protein